LHGIPKMTFSKTTTSTMFRPKTSFNFWEKEM